MKPIKCNNTQEFLSNDILEEEYMNTYKLVSRIQMFFGTGRVHIKDRFVTSPSLTQKLYTILCIIVTIVSYVFHIQLNFSTFYDYTLIYCLISSACTIDVLSHVSNTIHVRFVNGESNTDFFVKLQKIDRLMRIDQIKVMNSMIHRVNFLVFITVAIIFVASIVFVGILGSKLPFLCFFGLLCGQIAFLIEMINCSNFVLFFFLRMRFLNAIIQNHINSVKSDESLNAFTYVVPRKILIRDLAAKCHDFKLSSMDIYLHEIFDGFKKFQNVHKFQVFLFCNKIVLVTLLGFEFVLYAAQKNLLSLYEILCLVAYATVDFAIVLLLSFRCETFFKEVKKTKRLSIGIMLNDQEGPQRKKARKMLKMIEESPPRFSVYDMWQLDAHIFVKIFSLVTTLMVTLLQFAFL